MAKRIKKPIVTTDQMKDWLKRYEQGESMAEIAAKDFFNVRTVHRRIEEAKQDREVKEARSSVLRNALEKHYRDLYNFARKLDSKVDKPGSFSWSSQEEIFLAALRQHLPRSPIWSYLNQIDSLKGRIAQLKEDAEKTISNIVKSYKRLAKISSDSGSGVKNGIAGALNFQLNQWAQGYRGLDLETSLLSEPAERGYVNIRYGFSQMGRVKQNHVEILREVLQYLESQIKKLEDYPKLEQSYADLKRVCKNLKEELAVIILRRIVPGRCRYCPI